MWESGWKLSIHFSNFINILWAIDLRWKFSTLYNTNVFKTFSQSQGDNFLKNSSCQWCIREVANTRIDANLSGGWLKELIYILRYWNCYVCTSSIYDTWSQFDILDKVLQQWTFFVLFSIREDNQPKSNLRCVKLSRSS